MITRLRLVAAAVALAVAFLPGCATVYSLDMKPDVDAVDETVVSPSLKPARYKRIMVLPPSGTKRGQFDSQVALFEREFLKNGLTVIASAVTGRVVYDESQGESKRVEGAAALSDAERALVMAKKSGADALLQIGTIGWSTSSESGRYFTLNPDAEDARYTEVDYKTYQSWEGPRLAFPQARLTFIGRLTDVASGEVIASFRIKSSTNWNLPSDYRATYTLNGTTSVLESQNFDYGLGQWIAEAREATISAVIARVAARIAGR